MTNGDKIRNLSDDELLHYIGASCQRCAFSSKEDNDLIDCLECDASCTDGTLQWLKQEANETEFCKRDIEVTSRAIELLKEKTQQKDKSCFDELLKKNLVIGCYSKSMYDSVREILGGYGYVWSDVYKGYNVGDIGLWKRAIDNYTCLIVRKNGVVDQAVIPNPDMTALEFIDKYEEMKELEEGKQ